MVKVQVEKAFFGPNLHFVSSRSVDRSVCTSELIYVKTYASQMVHVDFLVSLDVNVSYTF